MILPKTAIPQTPVNADAELVERARTGDAEACEALARAHRNAAYFLALQLLGNRDDALDVAQDALLRLFSTLHRFDVRRPVRPWLYQIVRNRVVDLYRRRKVRAHDSIDEVDSEGMPRFDLADDTIDVEGDYARVELRRRLWEALEQLTPSQREIIVLREYQDLSYNEIADNLSIPVGTVMSRLHGARKALRRVLSEDQEAGLAVC